MPLFENVQPGTVAFRLREAIDKRGYLKVMVTGDSTGEGTSSNGGVFLGLAAMMSALNVPYRMVGPRTITTEPLVTALARQTGHRTEGGLTTTQLVNGTGSAITNSLATDMATYRPDWVPVMSGFNDRGQSLATVQARFESLLAAVYGVDTDCAVSVAGIWFDYNAGNVYFDAGQRDVIDAQQAAVRLYATQGRPVEFVDTIGPMGTAYRTMWSTSATVPAPWHIDNPHLYAEGYGFVGALMVAKAFSMPFEEALDVLQSRSMFRDLPFAAAVGVAPAGGANVSVKAAETARRLVVTGVTLTQNATAGAVRLKAGTTQFGGDIPMAASQTRDIDFDPPYVLPYGSALQASTDATASAATTVVAKGYSSLLGPTVRTS